MSDKVKMFLSIVAILAIYLVAIPYQTYRMGYDKGRNSGAVEWASYGYSLAIDTVTSILDKKIAERDIDSTVAEIRFVSDIDTIVYTISTNGSSSNINDSITNKIK